MPDSLYKYSKLQKELEYFTFASSKIINPSVKRTANELLQKFHEQVQYIDLGHSLEYNGYIKPKNLRENIAILADIRRKMKKLADDILTKH